MTRIAGNAQQLLVPRRVRIWQRPVGGPTWVYESQTGSAPATVDGTSVGVGLDWTSSSGDLATDVAATDTNYAYAQFTANGRTKGLVATGFGFSLPANAQILGYQPRANIGKLGSGNRVYDNAVRLRFSAANVGADRSRGPGIGWVNGGFEVVTWGGASDDWGAVLTPADVNDPSFGYMLKAQPGEVYPWGTGNNVIALVDTLELTVFYRYAA